VRQRMQLRMVSLHCIPLARLCLKLGKIVYDGLWYAVFGLQMGILNRPQYAVQSENSAAVVNFRKVPETGRKCTVRTRQNLSIRMTTTMMNPVQSVRSYPPSSLKLLRTTLSIGKDIPFRLHRKSLEKRTLPQSIGCLPMAAHRQN